ncbi:hypothetical protein MMC18_003774 [Xylographa bjoerkii]|nr:hypothetical protein [Xylographa bjoerkii]
MSSQSADETSDLSDLLTRSWHNDARETIHAKQDLEKKHHTVSSIAEHYLRSRIDHYSTGITGDQAPVTVGTVSLVSLAIGKINQVLSESNNLQSDIATIAQNLNSTTLCEVLRDGRLPYVVLRAFLDLPYETVAGIESGTLGKLQDIDEAVLLNEKYIRTRSPEENADGVHLLSIEDLGKILGHLPSNLVTATVIRRKDPPPGGFECLSEKRERTVKICATSESYCERFHRLTKDVLKGLDWSHVFLAGGMGLTTLMHTDESKDTSPHVQDSDLDIYIYGIDADQANHKIDEIYNVWKNSLPADTQNAVVVKNAKTITFISDYPKRRIQVVLKLFKSPTQVLLGFDLDACAIGFDGRRALMLPRCARAIETGYNVFTMDIIWGHYLKGRCSSREARIFKYAERGFGLRILPAYVRSLEEGHATIPFSKIGKATEINESHQDDGSEEVRTMPYLSGPRRKFDSRDTYRMPAGPEAGIKTLKRVVYLGQDFTNRFLFGNTPLHYPSKPFLEAYPNTWIEDYEARKEHTQARVENFDRLLAEGTEPRPLESNVYELDGVDNFENPDCNQSLAMLELFVRHVEGWRLTVRKEASFDFSEHEKPMNDARNYDGSSSYAWDSSFSALSLGLSLDLESQGYFRTLKQVICAKLQIPYQDFGYGGYLTRRIRQHVHGLDLKSVMEKQITIPMMVPYDLENFLLNVLPNVSADVPAPKPLLIPAHDPNMPPLRMNAPRALPRLHDAASEDGNLRYWVITNKSMWAGQNSVTDEVSEILWSLFDWFRGNERHGMVRNCTDSECVWQMAESIRRRAVQPKMPQNNGADSIRSTRAIASNRRGLSPAEVMLFRAWALAEPNYKDRRTLSRAPRNFEEDAYLYPVPDELFWKDGMEGDWSGEYMPQWRYFPVDEKVGQHSESRKRKSDDTLMDESA